MEDALDAAGLLLSVGATSMQRRSSRCQAAAETRRAAEAVDQQLPFGAGAARTGAGAGAGLTVGRRGKKTIPALQARSEVGSVGPNMLYDLWACACMAGGPCAMFRPIAVSVCTSGALRRQRGRCGGR